MEIKDFISNFADQFEETDASEFKAETRFRDLDEWSSLIGLGVISMVDEEYDIAIDGNDMRSADTIQDLFEIVKAKAE